MKPQTARILLVEDEVEVAETVSDLLVALGYEVSVAHNADAALTLLREQAPFHLLVSDIVMPGTSGAELAKEARHMVRDIKVILTSGYSASVADSARREVPGCCYLSKPYSMKELSDAVSRSLEPDETSTTGGQ